MGSPTYKTYFQFWNLIHFLLGNTFLASSVFMSDTSSMTKSWNPCDPLPLTRFWMNSNRKFRWASHGSPSVVLTPSFPFWKNVPENIFGRPENSFLSKASLIKGQEFKTTTGLVPINRLKMSPYFWPNFLQLRPTFLTSMNGTWPTNGNPIGPKIKQNYFKRGQNMDWMSNMYLEENSLVWWKLWWQQLRKLLPKPQQS